MERIWIIEYEGDYGAWTVLPIAFTQPSLASAFGDNYLNERYFVTDYRMGDATIISTSAEYAWFKLSNPDCQWL